MIDFLFFFGHYKKKGEGVSKGCEKKEKEGRSKRRNQKCKSEKETIKSIKKIKRIKAYQKEKKSQNNLSGTLFSFVLILGFNFWIKSDSFRQRW